MVGKPEIQRSGWRRPCLYGVIGLVCLGVGTLWGLPRVGGVYLSTDVSTFFSLSLDLAISSLGGILLGIAGRMFACIPTVSARGGSKAITTLSTMLIVLSALLAACAACGILISNLL